MEDTTFIFLFYCESYLVLWFVDGYFVIVFLVCRWLFRYFNENNGNITFVLFVGFIVNHILLLEL